MIHRDNKIPLSFAAAAAAFACLWMQPSPAQPARQGDGPVACQDFQRGPNGSWTVLRPTTIMPQGVRMNLVPGQTFAKNQFVNGIEVTTVLDRNCGNM
jgi:hypothetical protein